MSGEMTWFSKETVDYLINSFKKADLDDSDTKDLLECLTTAPKWTTIRVNNNLCEDLSQECQNIQGFIDQAYEIQNSYLDEGEKLKTIPKCSNLNDLIRECIVFDCSNAESGKYELQKLNKTVIIDVKCAQAILRGADIFIPGIIGLSPNIKAKDEVSIYADLAGKCLKGADSSNYITNHSNNIKFIGNGWCLYDRDEIFKNSSSSKTGTGIKIKKLEGNSFIPSFDKLDNSKYYPQNLPSIICARVLDVKEDQDILDMCAAPGGKTTHLAEISKNKSRIIAFDKIGSKIKSMKIMCEKMNAFSIDCKCQDATKIDFEVYKRCSFDRILVDAPCSALGQRPLIYNDITFNQLKSYANYQRMILENAYELLKPGGYMVYSTCTITLEENEEQVSWFLNKYPQMKLVSQEPHVFSDAKGLKCAGLSKEQTDLLQRFSPKNTSEQNLSVYSDTNGFFIAKFLKQD